MLAAFDGPASRRSTPASPASARSWITPGPTAAPLRVRMAIHSGSAENARRRLLRAGAQPGRAPAGDRARRPGARVVRRRGDARGRPAGRRRPARPGRPSAQGPEPAGARLPARRARACRPSSRRSGRARRRSNLPAQLTSFVGREREVAAIGALLETNRLVSLVGVGGTGKTRLDAPGRGRRRRSLRRRDVAGGARAAERPEHRPARGRARARDPRLARPAADRGRDGLPAREGPPAPGRQLRAPDRRRGRPRGAAAGLVPGVAGPRDEPRGARRPGRGDLPGAVARASPTRSTTPTSRPAASTEAVRLFVDRATADAADLPARHGQRGAGGRDLPAAGRHPARPRARRRADQRADARTTSRRAWATGSAC